MTLSRQSSPSLPVDLLTAFCLAMLLASVNVTLHEGVHALACVGLGGYLVEFSAQHVTCVSTSVLNQKFVSGSAAIVNILIGLGIYFLLRTQRNWSGLTLFGVWLFMLLNLTSGFGYFAFSGVSGVGDYATVIHGLPNEGVIRIVMTIFGFTMFMVAVFLALKTVGRFIGGNDMREQVRRLQKLGLVSYAGAITVAVVAGFFNPYGITGLPAVAGIIAIAGGHSPLAWMAQWFQAEMFEKHSAENNLTFSRSWPHIIAGLIAAALYGFVLGPSIQF